MRIFLIRHGQSEGNHDAAHYQRVGDPNIGLTDKGWEQAIAAGRFLKNYLEQHPQQKKPAGFLRSLFSRAATARPIRLWSSYFKRAKQTSAGVMYGADGAIDEKNSRVSAQLVEQNYGLRAYLPDKEERKARMPLLEEYAKITHRQDKFWGRQAAGESPLDAQSRVLPVIGAIMRDKDNGIEDVVVVTHGAMLKVMAMAFMKIDPERFSEFKTPENTSIYLIEGGDGAPYSFKQIYDGEAGQAVDVDWGTKLGAYESVFPEVPARFRTDPPGPQGQSGYPGHKPQAPQA